MADIAVTAANLRPMEGIEARLIPMIADEAITKGQPVYRKTNGKAGVARANAVGTSKLVGIATTSVAAGLAFEALYHGRLAGYVLTSQNPGTTIYLSITATGLLADAAAVGTGNVVVPVGTVHCMTDQDLTKFLFVDIPQNAPTGTAL
jgi:hypothetical protein